MSLFDLNKLPSLSHSCLSLLLQPASAMSDELPPMVKHESDEDLIMTKSFVTVGAGLKVTATLGQAVGRIEGSSDFVDTSLGTWLGTVEGSREGNDDTQIHSWSLADSPQVHKKADP